MEVYPKASIYEKSEVRVSGGECRVARVRLGFVLASFFFCRKQRVLGAGINLVVDRVWLWGR